MKLLDQNSQANWKYIAIVAVLGLVVGGGVWYVNSLLVEPQIPQMVIPRPAISPTPAGTDISTWQTYRSEEFGFEVRYPKEWNAETSSVDKERRETTAEIFYFPSKFPSFAEANEGFVLNIFYSERSAEAEGDVEEIKNNPKSYFLSETVECIKQEIPQVSKDYLKIECYAKGNKGIAILSVGIEDLNGKYSKPVNQILSTFRFVGQ